VAAMEAVAVVRVAEAVAAAAKVVPAALMGPMAGPRVVLPLLLLGALLAVGAT